MWKKLRLLLAAIVAGVLAVLVPASVADARPVGAETIRLVVQTDRFRVGAEHAAAIWNGGQTRYRVQLNDRCYDGDVCVIVRETWYAGDWFQLDGIRYGTEVYTRRNGAGVVLLPTVLSSPQLMKRFGRHLDAAGQSRGGVPTGTYVVGSLVAMEIGNHLGIPNGVGSTIFHEQGWPNGRFSEADAEAVWAGR